MRYKVSALESLRLEKPESVQAVLRNIAVLLATRKGSVPLYRDFGLDVSYLDHPLDLAQNLFAVAAMEAVERWEPRVQVTGVSFVADGAEGSMKAKVVIAGG